MPTSTTPPTSMGSADPAPAGTDPFLDSLSPHAFVILRRRRQRTATGGYTVSEEAIPGSPFQGFLHYRRSPVRRDEAAPGTASLDLSPYLELTDLEADIRVEDIAVLPAAVTGSQVSRAKILRARVVAGTKQCDLELGAV